MQHIDKFVLSQRPYAVDLQSWQVKTRAGVQHNTVNAIWYRRKNKRTAAHMGVLWGNTKQQPKTAIDFLTNYNDSRYGGDCYATWDGAHFWGLMDLDTALMVLKPALEAYNTGQDLQGYDCWWVFKGA